MIEKFLWKRFDFWKEEREKHKKTPNVKFLENQTLIFQKFLREKHKEDTKLRIFRIKKGLRTCKNRKLKEKQKHAIDTKLRIWN